ncbi:hypothetical protein BC830DRAFT_669641 [Chytriomyces sp. MP71]|nr:hypothetical protein BC830DRAFT_669641 [Chytriomyces sp. MP71]
MPPPKAAAVTGAGRGSSPLRQSSDGPNHSASKSDESLESSSFDSDSDVPIFLETLASYEGGRSKALVEMLYANPRVAAQIGQLVLNRMVALENSRISLKEENLRLDLVVLEQGREMENLIAKVAKLESELALHSNKVKPSLSELNQVKVEEDTAGKEAEDMSSAMTALDDMIHLIRNGETTVTEIELELEMVECEVEALVSHTSLLSMHSTAPSTRENPNARSYASIEAGRSQYVSADALSFVPSEAVDSNSRNKSPVRNATIDSRTPSLHASSIPYCPPLTEVTPTFSIASAQLLALKEENRKLLAVVKRKDFDLVEKANLVFNLETVIAQTKEELLESKENSLSHISKELEARVKASSLTQRTLTETLLGTKEELIQTIKKLAESESKLSDKIEEVSLLKKKLGPESFEELHPSLLRQGNVDLGAQIAKLSSDFGQTLWHLRDVTSQRDILQSDYTRLNQQFRELKQRAANTKKTSTLSHRAWGIQTDPIEILDATANDCQNKLEFAQAEMRAQETLIEILKRELEQAKDAENRSVYDSRILREELSGFKRDQEELHSSIDGYLNHKSEKLPDNSLISYKMALFEARKKNQELNAKLTESEKSVEGQKGAIYSIGAQLAQQSLRLGEIEWELKQKEADKERAMEKIQSLEMENQAIVDKLSDAVQELDSLRASALGSGIPLPTNIKFDSTLNATKVAYDHALAHETSTLANQVAELESLKAGNSLEIRTASNEIKGIQQDIVNLNQTSNLTESQISDIARQLALKSEENEHYVMQINYLQSQLSMNSKLPETHEQNYYSILCGNCEKNEKERALLLNRLDEEMDVSRIANENMISAQTDKVTMSTQVIELEKKLNAALEETETVKARMEAQLASYNEMKKLIQTERENQNQATQRNTILQPSDNSCASIPVIISEFKPLTDSKEFKSSDLLAGQLQRASNVQMQLEAVVRENLSLQESLRKLELKVSVAQDEVRIVKAVGEKIDSMLACQSKERSELALKLAELQKELSSQIMAKSELEAQIIDQEKKAALKPPPRKSLVPKFSRSRHSSATSNEATSPASLTQSPTGTNIEGKIVEERNRLASDLSAKVAEVASLTKEVSQLTVELAASKRATSEAELKNNALIREHEDELKSISLTHAEVEECLQNQIQELVDQASEPRMLSLLNLEKGKSERETEESRLNLLLKTEQGASRKAQLALKEAETRADASKLQVGKLEYQIATTKNRSMIEKQISAQLVDRAQIMMDALGNEYQKLQEELVRVKAQMLDATSRTLIIVKPQENEDFTPTEFSDQVVATMKLKLNDVESELSSMSESKARAEAEFNALNGQFKQLSSINKEYVLQCTELSDQLKAVKVDLEFKNESCLLLEMDKKQLSDLLETVRINLQDTQARCSAAENQLKRLEAEMVTSLLCVDCRSKGEELESWKVKYDNAVTALATTQHQSDINEGESIEGLKSKESTIENLQKYVESLKSDLNEFETKIAMHSKLLAEKDEQLSVLQAELDVEKRQSKMVQHDRDSQIAHLQAEVLSVRSDLGAELSKSTQMNALKVVSIEAQQNQLDVSKDLRISLLESELNEAIKSLSIENSKSEKLAVNTASAISALEAEIESLTRIQKVQKSGADNIVASRDSTVELLQAENKSLIGRLEKEEYSKSILIAEHSQTVEAWKGQSDSLITQKAELEEMVASKQVTINTLRVELENIKERIKEQVRTSVARASNLRGNVADLESVIAQLEAKNEQLQYELNEARDPGRPKLEMEIEAELETLKLRMLEQAKLAIIKTANLKAQDDRIRELETAIGNHALSVQGKDFEISQLEEAVETLSNEYQTLQVEAQASTEHYTRTKTKMEEVAKLNIIYATNIRSKDNQIANLEGEITTLQSELNRQKSTVTSSVESMELLEYGETSKLKQSLAEAKSRMEELMRLSVVRATNLQSKDEKIAALEIT